MGSQSEKKSPTKTNPKQYNVNLRVPPQCQPGVIKGVNHQALLLSVHYGLLIPTSGSPKNHPTCGPASAASSVGETAFRRQTWRKRLTSGRHGGLGKSSMSRGNKKHQFHRENVATLARVPGSSLFPGLAPHISYICIHGGSIPTVPTFFHLTVLHSIHWYIIIKKNIPKSIQGILINAIQHGW